MTHKHTLYIDGPYSYWRLQRCHLHLALMRLYARSLVSFFSSSVRGEDGVGGGGGGAAGGVSGQCLSRRLLMYAAICSSVGFILFRKEFTFLMRCTAHNHKSFTHHYATNRGDDLVPTYFFTIGITGFKMASNKFKRKELPVKTQGQLAFKDLFHFLWKVFH